jgi:hypothetical protein
MKKKVTMPRWIKNCKAARKELDSKAADPERHDRVWDGAREGSILRITRPDQETDENDEPYWYPDEDNEPDPDEDNEPVYDQDQFWDDPGDGSILRIFLHEEQESDEDSEPEPDQQEQITPKKAPRAVATKKSPAKRKNKASVLEANAKKADEVPWLPLFCRHQYRAKGHDRYNYVIDLPESFTGEAGRYGLKIENGNELVVTRPVPEVISDSNSIHSLLANEFGRIFSDDSAKTESDSTEDMKGKVAVFRHKLGFPCHKTFAGDLENPGILFRQMEGHGKVLILELKSIHQIVTREQPVLIANIENWGRRTAISWHP